MGAAHPEPPVVVALPGFDGSGALFRPLQQALGDALEFRAVAYGDYASLEDYIEQAEAAVPVERPVILLGESFSGPIALSLLARARRDYIGGVLAGTFAEPPLSLLVSLADKLRLASFVLPSVSEQILRVFCLNGVSDIARIREVVAVVRQVSQRAIASRLAALSRMNATPELAEIDVPVLLLRAANDRVVRSRYMEPLRQTLTDLEEVVLRGPHLLLQSAPGEAAKAIQAFTKRVHTA
ncbi:MAG: alpha/beta fold hydrolase [Pseudomonadota bacterium]